MKYRYGVYGLNIESEIELNQLIELDKDNTDKIDVTISYKKMTEEIIEMNKENKTMFINIDRNNTVLYVKDIAIYYIKNGNKIMIDTLGDPNKKRIKSFLLGWAFGVIFVQRNMLALHGATIIKNNKAFVISGESGAGKSTISSSLIDRGYKFSSDDVGVVELEGEDFIIYPSYPLQKLGKDSMEILGYDTEKYEINVKGTKRERYKVIRNDNFVNEPLPIEAVFQIEVVNDSEKVELEKVNGSKKLDFILDNLYFSNVEVSSGMRPDYFKKCLDMAKYIPLYKIKRPVGKFTVNEQIKLIEDVLINA